MQKTKLRSVNALVLYLKPKSEKTRHALEDVLRSELHETRSPAEGVGVGGGHRNGGEQKRAWLNKIMPITSPAGVSCELPTANALKTINHEQGDHQQRQTSNTP